MQLIVNGSPLHIDAPADIHALIEQLGLAGKRVAIELNGAIVPRSLQPQTVLNEGDRVEIVQAIGGG